MPQTLDSPFWGKVQELRDAVLDFRKSGKMVVAIFELLGIPSRKAANGFPTTGPVTVLLKS